MKIKILKILFIVTTLAFAVVTMKNYYSQKSKKQLNRSFERKNPPSLPLPKQKKEKELKDTSKREARIDHLKQSNERTKALTQIDYAELIFENKHGEILKLIDQQKIDLNYQGEISGQSFLMMAIHAQNKELIKGLLERGININLKDKRNQSALVFASSDGDEQLVSKLLEMGADPNIKFNKKNFTLLMDAAREGNLKTLKLLLEAGAQVNDQTRYQETALHFSAKEGHEQIVRELLKYGARSSKDAKSKTPSQYAKESNFTRIVDLFN
ncbi:ankyrin repeat domain-containing protein [Halobacteriovorax sp. GB3]|uniref:ankyrin repeat domain-containing protein n=1 Tax=Halobacteriovorax sp. GB3 TaxID=2719615 RepID=UPI002362A04C|nr:ankyrin repeat domain-containing protein [Halobacteriovorax sp. GB3]MDD0853199.1 ankyrin repeat domain-containing protein [Halobacteriovorax sp. GB3]